VRGVNTPGVAIKTLIMFTALNPAYAWLEPPLDWLSICDGLVPGGPPSLSGLP